MRRVNQFQFYELGHVIHPLTEFRSELKTGQVWLALYTAKRWLSFLLEGNQPPLVTSRSAATKLMQVLVSASPDARLEADAWIAELEKPLHKGWEIARAATEFEHVLAAELEGLATYFVSQKGIYSTNDLVENAEMHFAQAIQDQIPPAALSDIKQAGKCLAFDLDTAAGFHILRATETLVHQYYVAAVGANLKRKDRNWGAYVRNLNAHRKNNPDSQVDPKLISLIDQVREHHRNPVIHPELMLSAEEAQTLFSVCTGVIIAFANACAVLQPHPPPPSLPVMAVEP